MEALCGIDKSTHRYFQRKGSFSLNVLLKEIGFRRHERVSKRVSPSGTIRGPSGLWAAGKRTKASGRCGPSGRHRPALRTGTLRSTALRREVKLPVGRLFSRIGVGGLRAIGAVTGGRETFRGLAVLGAKIRPQGRRDATGGTGRGRRVGFSPAIPREGDTAPRSGGASLHGGVAEEGDGPEAGSLSRAMGLRLQRRQECPARTRSVGSRLRS